MSWSMPQQGQWPSAPVAMTPDMMNVGSYTPEQWAAMQQNWQQWAQWQQQYAQWQNQYGEKYAQQMQSMQAVGNVPCPPTSAPPPAPPPPDNPPPPYENNQPLYAAQPAPVPAPASASAPASATARAAEPSNLTSVNITSGNAQTQWSYGAEEQTPTPMNSDALKKLAEEEKLFDIQFQKWEEEIEKWRHENVNHPDKEAYKEYEQKFETCRAQLLERRQQMKQKRARLMSNAPNAATTPVSGKLPSAIPPPLHTPGKGYNQNQPQNYNQKQSQNYNQNQSQNYNQNKPPNYNQNQSKNFNQNQSQNYNSRQDYQNQQNYNKKQEQNYSNPNTSSYQQYNNPPPGGNYNRGNRGNIDPQDRYVSYGNTDDNYSTNDDYPPNENFPPEKSSFLPTGGPPKSIPGLDLVPDSDKASTVQQQDVIDITEDNVERNQSQRGPDYTTISKGINNILGDEKIMNILSMVRGNTPAGNAAQNNSAPNTQYGPPPNMGNKSGPPPRMGHNNGPPPGIGHNGPPPGMGHNGPPPNIGHNGPPPSMGHNGPPPSMGHNGPPPSMGHNGPPPNMGHNGPPPSMGHNGPPPGMGRNNGPPPGMGQNNGPMGHNNQNVPPNNQWNRNDGYNNQQQQFGNRQNYPMQQNQDQNRFTPNQRQMYDERQGSGGQDTFPDGNSQYGGPNMPFKNDQGPRQNQSSGPRPLMDLPIMNNDFSRGPPNRGMPPNMPPPNPPPPPSRPKWMDEQIFTPSFVVEYEHKPLRLKAREFIEPVHMFDYDHKSKDSENKKKDFEKEVDDLFLRKPRRDRDDDQRALDRYDMSDRLRERDGYNRDFERRVPREDVRDDYRHRPPREEFDDRRRPDDRFDDRRRDDRERDIRDRFGRREDNYRDRERDRERERERERDRDRGKDMLYRDRLNRDQRKEEPRIRSRSRERDTRKRGLSRDSEATDVSKRSRESNSAEKSTEAPKHVVMIDDILESPGREMRPEKIVIILRGPPGSGKSYLAKLIRDREAEYGGTARIMSIDDYFMQEGEIEEKDPTTGKIVKKPTLKYEYDEGSEESYLNSLKRAFKRSLTDGYFTFLIYDAVNDHLRSYADVWNFARQNGFQVYVCTMDLDAQVCHKRNIHGRSLSDIQVVVSRFFATPPHHIQLDATTLLQSASIPDVQMEDADDEVVMEDAQQPEVETAFTSKWEKMDDAAQLAKLDGTNKPLRPSQLSMEDYLQLDDWTPNKSKPGKKVVRWADIEERRQQEKMRAIGFVVGQTDWNRMTDPTMGSSALTRTKYIERVRRS